MTSKRSISVLCAMLFSLARSTNLCSEEPPDVRILKNERLIVEFNDGRLESIHDVEMDRTIRFRHEMCAVRVDDNYINSGERNREVPKEGDYSLTFEYRNSDLRLRVVYELKPGWRFISKQVFVSRIDGKDFFVKNIEMFAGEMPIHAGNTYKIDRGNRGTWAVFLRFVSPDDADPDYGLFFLIQNPMMKWSTRYSSHLLLYEPEMEWKAKDGEFVSDRACIGVYPMDGTLLPMRPISESVYLRDPGQAVEWAEKLDIGEVTALRDCVRAFLMVEPKKSARINVGWCENDYQIDVGTEEGRTEYKRIIDRAADLGIEYIVYGPANSEVSSLSENSDAWGWENVLWLGLGQKIRKDGWNPNKDPIPSSIQEMLDYAETKGVKLMAYVYPTLGFMQDPEWTKWADGRVGGYTGVDMGVRSFQDWFVKKMVDFQKRTGVGGFAFDHWYLNGDTSEYAKWYGMRRVLEELRKELPDVVLDGRQSTQSYGPWTYVSGMYPHPFGYDEQPGSFAATADLHTDRLSANHTRAVNWMFSVEYFCPIELVPGFITHQTQRGDSGGTLRKDAFRRRDWDYLGWRYSMISSIATAPFNHVVNMIPARDEDEFKALSPECRAEFRAWLDWADDRLDILRNLRPIIGPPMIDRVDGTAAFKGAHGYIFLFNPNYQRMNAEFTLDHSIGLTEGDRLMITEIYPNKGNKIGKANSGFWRRGDEIVIRMEGTQAMILEVVPVSKITEPVLFNVVGEAALSGDKLRLENVSGEVGTEADLLVAVPSGKKIRYLTVNGKQMKFKQSGDVISADVRFAGRRFSHSQGVGEYDRNFSADEFTGDFKIPERVFAQLEARKQAWPVPYTEDDLLATWLGPWRLLLFVDIADAEPDMDVSMTINGKSVEMRKAYNGIYGGDRTFMGFYADISSLEPDKKYTVDLQLPDLSPGQFHGLYFEGVETEYTTECR